MAYEKKYKHGYRKEKEVLILVIVGLVVASIVYASMIGVFVTETPLITGDGGVGIMPNAAYDRACEDIGYDEGAACSDCSYCRDTDGYCIAVAMSGPPACCWIYTNNTTK